MALSPRKVGSRCLIVPDILVPDILVPFIFRIGYIVWWRDNVKQRDYQGKLVSDTLVP